MKNRVRISGTELIIIIVMAITIIGLVGFIIYDKVISDGKQESNKIQDNGQNDGSDQIDDKDVSIKDTVVIETMDKILCDFSESEICSFVEFAVYERYFKELLSYDNLDDDAISGMVYMYSDKHNLIDTTNIDKINQEILETECTNQSGSCAFTTGIMSVEKFQEVMKNLFGNKVAYRHVNIDYLSSRPLSFYYHSGSNTYRGPSGIGGFCFSEIYTKLLSASKYDNQLGVDVMAYHGNDCGSMYYTFDSEEPFYDGPDDDDNNGIDPDIIFDRFANEIQKYRFVFTEDNGQYYFDHVEKVD